MDGSRLLVEIVGIDGAGKTTVVREASAMLGATPRKVAAYTEEFHALARRTGEAFGARAEAAVRGCAVATALEVIAETVEAIRALRLDPGRLRTAGGVV